MCFRPSEIGGPKPCPSCGREINPIGGFFPPKCPFCGTDYSEAGAGDLPGDVAPAAPVAPTPPSAPDAPVPPSAPGA